MTTAAEAVVQFTPDPEPIAPSRARRRAAPKRRVAVVVQDGIAAPLYPRNSTAGDLGHPRLGF